MSFRRCLALLIAVVVLMPMGLRAQQTKPVFAPVAPSESIKNLDALKEELKQYHECTSKCGCYAKDLDLQANRAVAFLRERAARRAKQEKLAVVLDIDETTLSNYAEMLKEDFEFDGNVFDAWVKTAAAPAIPGTLRLYKEAQRLGVSVFFLTGRGEAERAATEQNLRAQGFEGWQELIMRKAGQSPLAIVYKPTERAGIVAKGYTIVLNVGDQWSDLKGDQEAEYSVKYPDPYYFIK
jgi:acid phosphatase